MTDSQQLLVVRIDRSAPPEAVARLLDGVLEGVPDVHVVRGTHAPYADALLDVHLRERTQQWHVPLRTPAFHSGSGDQFRWIAEEDLRLRHPWTLFAAPSDAQDDFLGTCVPRMYQSGIAEHGPVMLARVLFQENRLFIVPQRHWRWNDESGWVGTVVHDDPA